MQLKYLQATILQEVYTDNTVFIVFGQYICNYNTVFGVRFYNNDVYFAFPDTFNERNNLMERIYPKLKEHCQSVGYDFQVVDMRWGVRDEATDDHMTSELCMRELRACQKLSTGPNFIVSYILIAFSVSSPPASTCDSVLLNFIT